MDGDARRATRAIIEGDEDYNGGNVGTSGVPRDGYTLVTHVPNSRRLSMEAREFGPDFDAEGWPSEARIGSARFALAIFAEYLDARPGPLFADIPDITGHIHPIEGIDLGKLAEANTKLTLHM